MIPKEKVEAIVSRHNSIEKELSSGNIDPKKFAEKSKEYSELGNILKNAKNYLNFNNEKTDLENIINDEKGDSEMINLAKKELIELNKQNEINENKLKVFLLPKDLDDKKNAIVEIRAGTGGLEATLFCSDLFKMYEKVCTKKKMEN
jgi:peptide chain release factor 1